MKAGAVVRPEWPGEDDRIAGVVAAAFASAPHSNGAEAAIVAALRADDDLTLSLVATGSARLIGHIAFSPVSIADGANGWFGLGPVAVLPEVQRHGIGSKLIRAGLALMTERGAKGVVVLGDPAFYSRFGFKVEPGLTYPGVPAGYFQALLLAGNLPTGQVRYAPAFG